MRFFETPRSVVFGIQALFTLLFIWSHYFMLKGGKEALNTPELQDLVNWKVFNEVMAFGFVTGVALFLFLIWGTIHCGIKEYNEYRKKFREETGIEQDSSSN